MHLPCSLSQIASLRRWEREPRFVVPTSVGCDIFFVNNPKAESLFVPNHPTDHLDFAFGFFAPIDEPNTDG
jgi:hypothetical protein